MARARAGAPGDTFSDQQPLRISILGNGLDPILLARVKAGRFTDTKAHQQSLRRRGKHLTGHRQPHIASPTCSGWSLGSRDGGAGFPPFTLNPAGVTVAAGVYAKQVGETDNAIQKVRSKVEAFTKNEGRDLCFRSSHTP